MSVFNVFCSFERGGGVEGGAMGQREALGGTAGVSFSNPQHRE